MVSLIRCFHCNQWTPVSLIYLVLLQNLHNITKLLVVDSTSHWNWYSLKWHRNSSVGYSDGSATSSHSCKWTGWSVQCVLNLKFKWRHFADAWVPCLLRFVNHSSLLNIHLNTRDGHSSSVKFSFVEFASSLANGSGSLVGGCWSSKSYDVGH